MNIYQKVSAITAELGTVAKNLSVKAGANGTYKAVSERDILDAVKPLEVKYGVYSYPLKRITLESERLESETKYKDDIVKKTSFYTRIETTYRFVNTENPDEYIDTTVFSVGIDPQDKGDGKAMTYADKYALMKIYKISTGDDPDKDGSEDTNYTPVDPNVKLCSICHKPIKAYIGKQGQMVYPPKHIELSMKTFNRIVCIDCINEGKVG